MSTSSSPSARAWVIVALLWLVACLNYLDRLILTTMHDPIRASITMTEAQFGLLTSVFLWVYGFLSPFGGYLADRFSRRKVILASLFVWSAMTWLTGRVNTFPALLLTRALMGVSEACYIPAALALIADYHRDRTRSLATGLHMSGVYAGAALGGLGGYFAEHFGWRAGFTTFGVFGVGYALVLVFWLQDAPRDDSAPPASGAPAHSRVDASGALLALFRTPAFHLLLGVTAFFGMANWGINGWLPTYLKEHFHLSGGVAGLSATGYIQVASFGAVLGGGAWADRWSRSNPRARALVPAIGFCVGAPCLFLAAATDFLPLSLAGLVLYAVSRGFLDANLMPALRQVTDERYSATGYGFLNFISCLAGGIMIFVGGWLKDARVDLNRIFECSAVGLGVAAVMLFAVKGRPPGPKIETARE